MAPLIETYIKKFLALRGGSTKLEILHGMNKEYCIPMRRWEVFEAIDRMVLENKIDKLFLSHHEYLFEFRYALPDS